MKDPIPGRTLKFGPFEVEMELKSRPFARQVRPDLVDAIHPRAWVRQDVRRVKMAVQPH